MNFKKMKLEDLKKLATEKILNSKKEILINFLETIESSKKLNPIGKIESSKKLNPIGKIETIDDTGIIKCKSNDGKRQTILFKYGKLFWKLDILSESYDFQSYIRLYSSSDLCYWNLVKNGNPKIDYNISLAYKEYTQFAYSNIIKDYKKLIKKMS